MSFVYDEDQPNGAGRLTSAAVTGQATDVKRGYGYNAYGRPTSTFLELGAVKGPIKGATEYDPAGRPKMTTFPNGNRAGADISARSPKEYRDRQCAEGLLF